MIINVACLPMIGHFFDTMIVASSDKEWLSKDLSHSKWWKLFWATLGVMLDIPSQYMYYCLVLLCEVYCVIV